METRRVYTRRIIAVFLLIAVVFGLLPAGQAETEVSAAPPYLTWTKGPGGSYVITQAAYEPSHLLRTEMRSPEDLYIDEEGAFYIADTGNSRIIYVSGDEEHIIGEDVLSRPTGVFARDDRIYVADYGSSSIYIFEKDGTLVSEFGRPDEALFGANTRFAPRRLVVDARENIYVLSEGSVNGIMQLTAEGTFMGYVGSNQVAFTPLQNLQRSFFTEAQMAQLFRSVPPSPSGLAIDDRGLIHTVTTGQSPTEAIKKFSVAGENLFAGGMDSASSTLLDMAVSPRGNVLTLDRDGYIDEYDSYGNLIFRFGGSATGLERFGVLSEPTAIALDPNDIIYVLDAGKQVIQVYRPTDFAREIHLGLTLFREGLYVEGEEYWTNILRGNSSFTLAYQALANANFKRRNNDTALTMYELAEDKQGYSEAFWEIRNDWLQANLATIIIVLAAALILWRILKALDRRKGIFKPFRRFRDKLMEVRFIREVSYMFYWMRHPMDGAYEMKRNNRFSVLSATFVLLLVLAWQITDVYVTSYLFSALSVYDTSILNEILVVLIPFLLFVGSNYLVSTIRDGEGRIKDVYRASAYSLAPYAIFALPLQFLTNGLTYNEAFIYDFLRFVIIAWCVVLLVTSLMQTHNYSFREVLMNLALTVFTMILFVLVFVLMFLLITQETTFIRTIFEEVLLRVRYR